jgi:NADPH-dependent 7-cyano-7-deazaguanine reductase QueF
MDYVPQDSLKKVQDYLESYRKIKIILEELCEISRELLRRREKF